MNAFRAQGVAIYDPESFSYTFSQRSCEGQPKMVLRSPK